MSERDLNSTIDWAAIDFGQVEKEDASYNAAVEQVMREDAGTTPPTLTQTVAPLMTALSKGVSPMSAFCCQPK